MVFMVSSLKRRQLFSVLISNAWETGHYLGETGQDES